MLRGGGKLAAVTCDVSCDLAAWQGCADCSVGGVPSSTKTGVFQGFSLSSAIGREDTISKLDFEWATGC